MLAPMRAPRPYVAEAVDPTELSPAGPWRAVKQAGLLLLALAWIGLGLVGHDPWKVEDATSFGLALDIAQRGDMVVPQLAGEDFLAQPPLLPALSALSIRLLSPPLEPFDAARLVAGGVLAVILLFTALASLELSGRAYRWLPVLILIGSVGLWDRAHALSPELGLTAGMVLAMYGFALALRRPVAGGVALGIGCAVAFGSRGLIGPAWVVITGAVLPSLGGPWRTRAYAITAGVALIIALALALPWPIALWLRGGASLGAWLDAESWRHHIALPGMDGAATTYYFRTLLWFAFPALPLIGWMLWTRGRGFNGGLSPAGVRLPGVLALVMLASLIVYPDPRANDALPLLAPLALLASLEVDSLTRGFSAALDWFGILTFGLLALVVWGIWIDARLYGMSSQVASLFRDTEVGYQPTFRLGAIAVAVALTILWIMLVRPARRSNRRTLLNWAAGVTLVWCLYSTIWLPYLDSRRTYRHVVESSAAYLLGSGCVASRNLGDSQRVAWQYFANLITVREEVNPAHACADLLVQYGRQEGPPTALPGWFVTWDGRRRGDDTERYVLYRRERG